MRIDLEDPQAKSLKALRLSHGKEEITWNVAAAYERANFTNLPALFDEINAFWSKQRPETQEAIWNVYKAIHQDLVMVEDSMRLQTNLRDKVTTLYELMPFENVKQWSYLYWNIQIPPNIKKEYGPNDHRTRTYLRDDYYDLAVFSVTLKAMLPVFGEFLVRVKPIIGANFKEKLALNLLSHSSITKSDPWLRLVDYIEASVENETLAHSAILGGLGTAELPGWLLSKAVVRRVVIGEVGVVGDKNSIISNVFHTLSTSLNSMDRNFKGRINDKIRPREGSDEDNMSYAETYKVKQEISDGDLAILSVYTEQTEDMAIRVDPTIDLDLLRMCLETAHHNPYIRISQHHLTLTQWVLASAISARGVPSLNKPALLRSMAVTQALLWHWGFFDLAAMMMAEEIVIEDEGLIEGSDEKPANIPKNLKTQLLELYPHYQRKGRSQRDTQLNVGLKAIDSLSGEMYKSDWRVHGPAPLMKKATFISGDRTLITPLNVRIQLANLLIHLVP